MPTSSCTNRNQCDTTAPQTFVLAICVFIKCRKAQQEARARGSTNWQAPPPSVELGKPEPAPGHWRPADEMQTQTPV